MLGHTVQWMLATICAVSASVTEDTLIGHGFKLHGRDILGDFSGGSTLFKNLDCTENNTVEHNQKYVSYYEDTESFYSMVSTSSGVSASLKGEFTMGATLGIKSSSLSSQKVEVTGSSLNILAFTGSLVLRKDCENSQPLDEDFESSFLKLPANVEHPEMTASWQDYHVFIQKYGSHFPSEALQGGRIQHWLFSEHKEGYTERSFHVRACLSFSTITEAGLLGISGCSNFSQEEIQEASSLQMSSFTDIVGGDSHTRAALQASLTLDNVKKFIANPGQTAIANYRWTAIWELLQNRYLGSEHYAKAVNLQWYYEGLLDFGCSNIETQHVVLRHFARSRDYFASFPTYECRIAKQGCRDSDSDCHLGYGLMCYCYGDTCIDHKSISTPDKIKTQAVVRYELAGSHNYGLNRCCYYQASISCSCNRDYDFPDEPIWKSANSMTSALRRGLESVQSANNASTTGVQCSSTTPRDRCGSLALPALLISAVFFTR